MGTKIQIERHYTGHAGKKYFNDLLFVPEISYSWVAEIRKNKIQSLIKKDDTLFEYGVGNGWNIASVACKKKLGFDINDSGKSVVERNNIEFIHDLKQIHDRSLDAALCHHVLEHTGEPLKVLSEMRKMLVDNGLMLLYIPYEKERRYRKFNPKDLHHHLYSWNLQTIGNLVESAGYKVRSGTIDKYGYDRFAAVMAVRFSLGKLGFRFIKGLLTSIRPLFEGKIIAKKI